MKKSYFRGHTFYAVTNGTTSTRFSVISSFIGAADRMEDDNSEMNKEIKEQVPGYVPKKATTKTGDITVTEDKDGCRKLLHTTKPPCLNGGFLYRCRYTNYYDDNL